MGLAGTTLAEMLLVIEGAIQLYAGLPPLYQRAMAEGWSADAVSRDTLEGALNALKDRICALQTVHKAVR